MWSARWKSRVFLEHYDDVVSIRDSLTGTYTGTEKERDILPGSWIENGVRRYLNDIDYVYATIHDAYGMVEGCKIGFKLTWLVQDFEASSIPPYENRASVGRGGYYNYDLITPDPVEYGNGTWLHPFYQKWKIKIPEGYHGINSDDIEIVYIKTMLAGFKN